MWKWWILHLTLQLGSEVLSRLGSLDNYLFPHSFANSRSKSKHIHIKNINLDELSCICVYVTVIFMCVSFLPACTSMYQWHAWQLHVSKKKKALNSLELKLQLWPVCKSNSALNYWDISQDPYIYITENLLTWGSTNHPWYKGISRRSKTMHSGVYSNTRTPVNLTFTSRPVCSLWKIAIASLIFWKYKGEK